MSITISSTTGTFAGDPNGIFLDEDVTIDSNGNTLTISGSFSYNSTIVYQLLGSYSLPAPSTTLTNYVSLQVSATGVLQFFTSTVSMPILQDPNVLIIFNNSYPANAPSVQAFTAAIEPSL